MVPGYQVWLTPHWERQGRTRFDLALVLADGVLVSADARLPSALFVEAVARGMVPTLAAATLVQREPRWGESRLDLALACGAERWLIETKSITLVEEGVALFPDAPTARGRRHLRALMEAVAQGLRAAVVFVAQREDARCFRPYDAVDPEFGRALRAAAAAGVEVWAYRCRVACDEVEIAGAIPVELGHGAT
jgi:sugar fermentation stimulation protein A